MRDTPFGEIEAQLPAVQHQQLLGLKRQQRLLASLCLPSV